MGICHQDADFTHGGEGSIVFYPVRVSSIYGSNAFVNFVPFQNFRAEIRAKVFGWNRYAPFLCLERR